VARDPLPARLRSSSCSRSCWSTFSTTPAR
jgi:hypothetical protein